MTLELIYWAMMVSALELFVVTMAVKEFAWACYCEDMSGMFMSFIYLIAGTIVWFQYYEPRVIAYFLVFAVSQIMVEISKPKHPLNKR